MFRRPREALVASLAGSVLLLCALCALALLLRELGGSEAARLSASALLAVGAAVVAAHVVDLVLPRPQIAYGVPRGLLGLVAAVLAAAAVTWFRQRPEDLFGTLGAAIYGGGGGAVAGLVRLPARDIAVRGDLSRGGPPPPGSR